MPVGWPQGLDGLKWFEARNSCSTEHEIRLTAVIPTLGARTPPNPPLQIGPRLIAGLAGKF